MNKILNNILKGLLIALVIVVTGGVISLKLQPINTNKLILISSGLANTVKTTTDGEKEEVEKVVEVDTKYEELELTKDEPKENKKEQKDENKENITTEEKQTVVEKKEDTDKEKIIEKKEDINKETVKEDDDNQNTNSNNIQSEVVEEVKPEVTIKGNYEPNLQVASTITPLATYTGRITAYGPDCYGCTSGRTASGQYVLEGNIYYNDKTFGNIRIVAADRSLPFGTIVKISGLSISSDPILAIVLDRGGAIGFAEGKHAYFDLLYMNEASAMSFGRPTATFEILRNGY